MACRFFFGRVEFLVAPEDGAGLFVAGVRRQSEVVVGFGRVSGDAGLAVGIGFVQVEPVFLMAGVGSSLRQCDGLRPVFGGQFFIGGQFGEHSVALRFACVGSFLSPMGRLPFVDSGVNRGEDEHGFVVPSIRCPFQIADAFEEACFHALLGVVKVQGLFAEEFAVSGACLHVARIGFGCECRFVGDFRFDGRGGKRCVCQSWQEE